jgi:glycosyltransferase involved in cell wall biosynthesis
VSVKHGYSESFQTQHGLNPELVRKDVTSILTRWAARQAERVVCISSALQTFLTRSGLVPADKAVTIPYGFDFSGVPSLEPRGSLRFGNPQIVVPGRVVPVKQHHLLIEVLPALMTEFPTMSVVMVGGGPLLNSLRARTVALRLGDRVRWEGFRPNMHDYLRDSDLVVIPSAAEGFGLVVLEAWYQGKPVVAFDVPALNEIVESGVDGELVPPFDQGSLVETLRRLLSSAALRQVQGDAGQRKQVERYGLRAMTTATVEVMRPSAA